jgi:hypothetical protein
VANFSDTLCHVIPQQTQTSAPADVLDKFTCLEGVAATGKPSGAKLV